MKTRLAALLAVVGCPAAAVADGASLNPTVRTVAPVHVVTATAAFPDYVFVVVPVRPPGPQSVVELPPGTPVTLNPNRHGIELFAVPRAGNPVAADDLLRAVKKGTTSGAVCWALPAREERPFWLSGSLTVSYELRADPAGRLVLERTTGSEFYQCWIVGIAVPVGLAFAGFRFARWARRVVSRPIS